MVKAGQAGAELKSVGLASDVGQPHHHQAKFNITVPLPTDKERHLLSSSSASLHDNSLSEYSSHTHSGDSSVNDSGVVGDHDQDSLYDLTVNNIEGNIINCKEKKEVQPSKIDIPFVVSIGLSSQLSLIPLSLNSFLFRVEQRQKLFRLSDLLSSLLLLDQNSRFSLRRHQ